MGLEDPNYIPYLRLPIVMKYTDPNRAKAFRDDIIRIIESNLEDKHKCDALCDLVDEQRIRAVAEYMIDLNKLKLPSRD